jgi:hypothetical protein
MTATTTTAIARDSFLRFAIRLGAILVVGNLGG